MIQIKPAVQELLGLFVDDVPFTIGIVLWLAVGGFVARIVSGPLLPMVLVLGFVAVLLASVWHTAKRKSEAT